MDPATRSLSYDDTFTSPTLATTDDPLVKSNEPALPTSPSMPTVTQASPMASSTSSFGASPSSPPWNSHPSPQANNNNRNAAPLVYRSQFSKQGGFPAPNVADSNRWRQQHQHHDDDESQPFDQRQGSPQMMAGGQQSPSRPPRTAETRLGPQSLNDAESHFSRPFDEKSNLAQASEYHYNDHSWTDGDEPEPSSRRGVGRNYSSDSNQARFSLPQPRHTEPRMYPDPSRAQSEQRVQAPRLKLGAGAGGASKYEQFDFAGHASEEGGDDDSLFEFEKEEEARRVAKQWRQSRRAKAKQQQASSASRNNQSSSGDDVEDDTSLEQDYGGITPSTSLQERAQAAWKRKSAAKRANGSSTGGGVSFGNSDTVHHFEPDETLEEHSTLGGRSLNSEYTKSAESEVEDVIKDILLMGSGQHTNPGRRKVKYAPAYKRQGSSAPTSDTDEPLEESDAVYETDNTPDPEALDRALEENLKKRRSSKAARAAAGEVVDEKKEDDPLVELWNVLDGGINAMSTALGLEGSSSKGSMEEAATSNRNLIEYASDAIMGPSGSAEEQQRGAAGASLTADGLQPAQSLEEDVRLIDLALQAARSAHKLRGYEFDDSHDINIVDDIKFSVIDLTLPLGIIFQDNEGGCWVTKVLRDGSAAKSKGVQVGDQLAAIDGLSAIHMKVNEIAKAIKARKGSVELTFLRYVGPMRPAVGDIAEEGYEVKASARIDPAQVGSRRSSRSGSSRRVSKTTTVPSKASQMRDEPRARTSRSSSSKKTASYTSTSLQEASSNEKKRFRLFGRKKKVSQ